MATNISDAYDAIETAISGALTSHNELSNPYAPDESNDLMYDAVWGMAFADGINLKTLIGCQATLSRDFVVTIARKWQITKRDLSKRKTTEKQLFEDQFLVIKELELSPTLQDSDAITKIEYESDGGLEFVRTGRTDLIMIRSVFNLVYLEELA